MNEGQQIEADILIKNGRIERMGKYLQSVAAEKMIDIAGKLVLPGMNDDQVHFREPGLTHKGNIASESLAAVAGGIASFMEMANVNPAIINLEALEDKYALVGQKSVANFTFYLGASNNNLDEIKKLDPN